jgi:hypothetical protein
MREQWDYRVQYTPANMDMDAQRVLTEIGEEGWDLVTAMPILAEVSPVRAVAVTAQLCFIFKRPKHPTPADAPTTESTSTTL